MPYNKLSCAKNKKGLRRVQSAELHFIPCIFFEGLTVMYLTFELLGRKKRSLFSLLNDKVKCLHIQMLNKMIILCFS